MLLPSTGKPERPDLRDNHAHYSILITQHPPSELCVTLRGQNGQELTRPEGRPSGSYTNATSVTLYSPKKSMISFSEVE